MANILHKRMEKKLEINIQKYPCGFQGKQVKKHFVAEYALQNHCNLGIWELKHQGHTEKLPAI